MTSQKISSDDKSGSYRKNADVLADAISLTGSRVLDVGCGDGSLTRFMTRNGARVTGIEPNVLQLERAQAADPVGSEDYVSGGAEALPFPPQSVDIVVLFNSLHHVPLHLQEKAIAEAARVIKPDGVVCIFEPVASGSHFEVIRMVDDETAVRAAAYEHIQNAALHSLFPAHEETFTVSVVHADFDAFRVAVTAPDPARAAIFGRKEADLRAEFARVGTPMEKGMQFDQPMRVNLLKPT